MYFNTFEHKMRINMRTMNKKKNHDYRRAKYNIISSVFGGVVAATAVNYHIFWPQTDWHTHKQVSDCKCADEFQLAFLFFLIM